MPFTEDGLFMDCLRGRSIARPAQRNWDAGPELAEEVMDLAEFAPADHRDRWRALARAAGWSDPRSRPYFESVSLRGIRLAKELLADDSVQAAPRPSRPASTRAWTACWSTVPVVLGTSMCSDRISGFEMVGGENLHGWYIGDGMTLCRRGRPAAVQRRLLAHRGPVPAAGVRGLPQAEASGRRGPRGPCPGTVWCGGAGRTSGAARP